MDHISLGSNCSITHQLVTHGLRTCAYPFDWARVSLSQLIQVLESDFADYSTLLTKFYSPAHSSLLTTNKYGIYFAHEILNSDQIPRLESSLESRIYRFKALSSSTKTIRYYRIELSVIKSGIEYIKKINKLVKLLDQINPNYTLGLIVHQDLWVCLLEQDQIDKKVQFYKFESYDPDWKMDQIKWKQIFGLESN
jgi:hypothetical protein